MPEVTPRSGDEEQPKAAEKEGQAKRAKAEGERRAEGQARREQREKGRVERDRQEAEASKKPQKRETPTQKKEPIKILLKDAKAVAEVIGEIRDEGQVEVSREDFESLRKVLTNAGYTLKEVERMSEAQIVVEAQSVLQQDNVEVEGVETATALERLEIEKVTKSPDAEDSEEQLSREKVEKKLNVVAKNPPAKPAETAKPVAEEQRESDTHIVESDPHLMSLGRDEAQEVLLAQEVSVEIPQEWEGANEFERRKWLEEKGIVNVVAMPRKDPVYLDPKTGVQILESEGEYALANITRPGQMTPDAVNRFFKEAGIEKSVGEKPKDWNSWSYSEQEEWLKGKGIRVLRRMVGGAIPTVQPDPNNPRNILVNDPAEVDDFVTSINQLVSLTAQGVNVPGHPNFAQWQAANTRINDIETSISQYVANNSDYYTVSRVAKRVDDMETAAHSDPVFEARLNTVMPANRRQNIMDFAKQMDEQFVQQYRNMDTQTKLRVFGELDTQASLLSRGLKSGLYSESLDRYLPSLYEIAEKATAEFPDRKEIIEWRLGNAIEGLRRGQIETLLKQPPPDWRDSEMHLNTIFRAIESTDFSLEQVQGALREAVNISLEMPMAGLKGEELKEARDMQVRLNEQIDAFQAMYGFFRAMETHSMNPKDVAPIFKNFSDLTFRHYFGRFTRDENGNEVANPHDATKNVNFLDEAIKVYMKQLNVERRKMDMVEMMTKFDDITGAFSDAQLSSLESWWGVNASTSQQERVQLRQLFETVRQEVVGMIGNRDWRVLGDKEFIVSEWYRQKTLLGAHLTDENGNKYLDLRKGEIREEFKQRLLNVLGLPQDKIDKLDAGGIIDQAANNAYRMAWNIAWSDYDGIRVWDMGANQEGVGGQKGMVAAYVFNQDTNMFFGRAIDHVWEYYVNESRGKVGQTNLIMQSHMLGDRGNLLPQNRTMVRFAEKFATVDQTVDFSRLVEDKRDSLRNLRKLDMDDNSDSGWARSAAVAELIDTGELSFEGVNWSEAFGSEKTNISKYSFVDLYGDRETDLSYTGGDVLQEYLQKPGTEAFFQINSIKSFYSKREVRMKPWMKIVIPAHFEMGKYWKKWWKMPYKLPHAEKDDIIEHATETNRLDVKYENFMKDRYLAWGPFGGLMGIGSVNVENARALWETFLVTSKETSKASPLIILAFFAYLVKEAFNQSASQLQGK